MINAVPTDSGEFDELMREIDAELIASGQEIPRRPIRAVAVVGRRFELSMPITKPPAGTDYEIAKNWPVSEKIYQWVP